MDCPIKSVCRVLFKRSLEKTGPTSSFARVCTSDHLDDLHWIAFFTVIFWLILSGFLIWGESTLKTHGIEKLTLTGLTATAAGILNWIYQTGSNRLGAVDLFGCEISTLCRVFVVIDFAQLSVAGVKAMKDGPADGPADSAKPTETRQFTSEENYTPVYDGKLSDLQPLDADVVTFVTEFYTYRKAMTDYLRRMAMLPEGDARRECAVQMIFMQFLMYESGHKAVERLIEFEPNQTESLINIFCSELVVYEFLLDEYRQRSSGGVPDYRCARLLLRVKDYQADIPRLYQRAKSHQNDPSKHWARAKTTADELRARFARAFPDDVRLMD